MKQKHTVHHKHNHLIIVLGLLVIAVGAFIFLHYRSEQEAMKPVVETHKSLVKKLPEDIKKQLQNASPSATMRIPMLLYHYVENVKDKHDKLRMSLNIPPNVFDEQVKTLSDDGYTFMTAKEVGEVLDGKMQLPVKPIVLTFDDGHWDVATDILPILEKYHAKATAYIIPGFTGGSDFMTQRQVASVAASGLVEIGAHTIHHLSLKGRAKDLVQHEVEGSKQMLEQTYHVQVVSFAYPNGAFDTQAAKIVDDSDFSTGVSTVPGVEQNQANRFFLYRIRPGMRTGVSLLAWLSKDTFAAY
jgi:peptidoglycan/xylan/chitin deacetylase (PgdA/CDA1 family)